MDIQKMISDLNNARMNLEDVHTNANDIIYLESSIEILDSVIKRLNEEYNKKQTSGWEDRA